MKSCIPVEINHVGGFGGQGAGVYALKKISPAPEYAG
jgi:hypothetical protein